MLVPDKFLRRNIVDLHDNHPEEFGRFIMALSALQASDDWPRICGIHGNTFKPDDNGVKCPTDPEIVERIGNTKDEPFYCAHSETKFIAWHTPYVYQFELLLNKYNVSSEKQHIALPYLWIENDKHPNLHVFINDPKITIQVDGKDKVVLNPLCADNVYYYTEKGEKRVVTRNGFLNPTKDSDKLKVAATNKELNDALYAERYPTFSSNNLFTKILNKMIDFNPLEIPHNNIHDFIGGEGGIMSDVPVSAYDPLFWLHHCNMDRFFYNWAHRVTNGFKDELKPYRIPDETLEGTLAPFSPIGSVYSSDLLTYVFGYENDTMTFLKIKNAIDFKKYWYTYDKIEIAPYQRPDATLEITGMPIPMETMHIEAFLFPTGTEMTEQNKNEHLAGSVTWFGINRYLKYCKRCERSRTNMKIDIATFMKEKNISYKDLGDYEWKIEGRGRLHQNDDGTYKSYTQEELLNDGSVELYIHASDLLDSCCLPFMKRK